MNRNFIVFILQLPSILFAAIACLMAVRGVGGWGWFLAASFLCVQVVKSKNDE